MEIYITAHSHIVSIPLLFMLQDSTHQMNQHAHIQIHKAKDTHEYKCTYTYTVTLSLLFVERSKQSPGENYQIYDFFYEKCHQEIY